MAVRKSFETHTRGYEIVAENTFGFAPEHIEKYGIKIVSRKKFITNSLTVRGCEKFIHNFKEQSAGYLDFFLYEVTVTPSGIFLHYQTYTSHDYGKIRCKPVKGFLIELEVPRENADHTERYVIECDEDKVLGKLLRVSEFVDGTENRLTILEDGLVISQKPER